MKKRRKRKSGYKARKSKTMAFKIRKSLEGDMPTTRDGAKKWLRRAIEAGRVIPPATCSGCNQVVRPRPHAYQPDVRQPQKIIWLCSTCLSNTIHTRGAMPAEAYSIKDLVRKLMEEAEKAELLRMKLLEAGVITAEQEKADREMWEERVAAAQAAYRREMGFESMEEIEELVELEEKEVPKSPFDLL